MVVSQLRTGTARQTTLANQRGAAATIADFALPRHYYYNGAFESPDGKSVELRRADPKYDAFIIVVKGVNIVFPLQVAMMDERFVRSFSNLAECPERETAAERVESIATASGDAVRLHEVVCGGARRHEYAYARIPSKFSLGLITAEGPAGVFDSSGLRALIASVR